jgi:predicted dehydrogenase
MSDRLGAAVVGLGVGEQHADAFLRAGCALRWVYDLDPGRSREVVARLHAGQLAESFEAILDDPAVDVVSIATYDDVHAPAVIQALRRGKHVFVEKPLCRTRSELTAVHAAWRESGRHLCSNLVLRAAPVYAWLRDAALAGELGEIYAFDGDYLFGRLHKITDGWRRDVPDYSVMQGGGIHLVDLMLWITGQRPTRVTAIGSRVVTQGTAFRHDDFVAATFMFDSGLVGRITANFGCVHRHQHVVRVFGTKATFVYDDCGPRIHRVREDGAAGQALGLDTLPSFKGALIPAFVQAVRQGHATGPGAQQDMDTVMACIAADQAKATGSSETISYL